MSSAIADLVVAIVNHSNRDDTLACLASLEADRERGVSVRVVVLDNASDDGSVDAIRVGASRRRGDRAGGQARLRRQPERDHPGDLEPLRAGPQQRHARRARRPRHARALPRRASRRRRGRPARGRPRRRGATLGLDVSDGLECGRARGRGQPPGRPCPRGGRLRLRLRADAAPQRADADRRLRRGLLHVRGGEGSLPPHPRRPAPRCELVPSATVVHLEARSSAGASARRETEFWRSQRLYLRKHHSAAGALAIEAQTALQRLALAAVVGVAGALPARLRPRQAQPGLARQLAHQARSSLRPPHGPGLRELADEQNARQRRAAA